jgi:hypothetical protein
VTRITELKPNQVFVFGSNLAGLHGGGAAADAARLFAARNGVNGAAQLSDNPQQLRTQYAALGELIKELEAISEDDRTPEQVADLKKNRALRRRVQKKQAGLVADRMAA